MVHKTEVSRQLKRLKVSFQFWCRPEIRELPHIMFDNEQLQHVLIGHYEGGFALLCATDQRVFLVDKKPFYLTIEDIRYDMICDVQFNHRLLNASVQLGTVHKTISFVAYNHKKLRGFTNYIQHQITIFRRQQNGFSADPPSHSVVRSLAPLPVINHIGSTLDAPKGFINPYNNTPLLIRKRVSRFY